LHTSLLNTFNALEKKKADVLKELSFLPDEKLNYKPNPDKWSINEILIHLLTAERFSVDYIEKKSMGIKNLDNTGIMESLKSIVLTISQRLPFLKFKEPKILAATARKMSHLEIIEEWDNVRKEMKETLDRIRDENLQKKIYKHPVAGYLNAKQGIGFLYQHLLHHLPQIRRLMK
jgi:hypothetical protein